MRKLLLYLSTQPELRKWVEKSKIARPLSSRFIAGNALPESLEVVKNQNRQGLSVTLDHLGENVRTLAEAETSRDTYIRALSQINAMELNSNVSLKPTQFGMDLSETACRDNVLAVVRTAARLRNFVRVDMESSDYTDRTLGLVYDLHSETKACGAVIQSYLHRSEKDIGELNRRQIRVRLCKGAYLEPPGIAFASKSEVDKNYLLLARKLLDGGNYPAIATHDEKMVSGVLQIVKEQKIAPEKFEFQMLYGIRRDLQRRLVREGWRVRVYIPFGKAWYPYFMRRLAERPANMVFLFRNLFRS